MLKFESLNSVMLLWSHAMLSMTFEHFWNEGYIFGSNTHPNKTVISFCLFSFRFAPEIQMRSSLDWTMATMQLSLIRRYCSIFWTGLQNKFQAIFKPCNPSELEFTHISWVFHSSYGKKRLFMMLMGCFPSHRKVLTGTRTVCFMWTRALSETPTVFSLYWGETGSI